MPFEQTIPVFDSGIRALCAKPYPGHKKGCPNLGKKAGCPPSIGVLHDVYDVGSPLFVIWNVFDFGAHVAKMLDRHPQWSQRQLACCLYWQGTARKQLRAELEAFERAHPGLVVNTCPEAMGMNVTATMASLGVQLEWPPETVAIQVALAGTLMATSTA
jgi:hypothetical protein